MEHTDLKKRTYADYGLLYFAVAVYSVSSVCSKLASGNPLLSWKFILFYGASILILMVYAVLWQMVLKRFPLSTAYAIKPVTMLLSMVWGVVLFHEAVSWNMILGAAIILFGIRVVTSHGK